VLERMLAVGRSEWRYKRLKRQFRGTDACDGLEKSYMLGFSVDK